MSWQIVEPLGVEGTKSSYLHALFPLKNLLVGSLCSCTGFLVLVAQ
jgi:hypothetical protein